MSTATIAAPSLPSPDLIRRRALHARGLRLLRTGTIVLTVMLGTLIVVFVGHVLLNYQPPPAVTITTTGLTSTPTVVVVPAPEPAPPPDDSGADGLLVPIAIAALTALPGTLTAIAGLVLVLRSHHYPTAPPPPPET